MCGQRRSSHIPAVNEQAQGEPVGRLAGLAPSKMLFAAGHGPGYLRGVGTVQGEKGDSCRLRVGIGVVTERFGRSVIPPSVLAAPRQQESTSLRRAAAQFGPAAFAL